MPAHRGRGPTFFRHRIRLTSARCLLALAAIASNASSAALARGAATDEPPQFTAEQLEFFEKKVRPLLAERCWKCHSGSAKRLEGGLRLDARSLVLKGGDTEGAAVPGKPEESLLIDAIRYGELYQMPPKSRLPAEEVALLTRWVEMGLPWPPDEGPTGESAREAFDLAARRDSYWAWQPVRPIAPPPVRDTKWPRDPIDHFILARLEEAGLAPAPPADRATLLRRLSFDLVGLPPTPEEIDAFQEDTSPQAFDRVVERLLASPHFGERWGRHWLDLVRYAESRGHEFDHDAPGVHHYRDYVIRALNADLPYDRFVTEHIAGDLLDPPRLHPTEGYNESILGTGFWFLGEWVHSPVSIRKDETDRFDNMLDVAGKTFLGMTVACARCHDHKFDAISQRDYYALAGYLQSASYRLVRFETLEHNRQVARDLRALRNTWRPRLAAAQAATAREVTGRLADYLLAARKLLPADAASAARAADVARDRGLDAGVLAAFAAHLVSARADDRDPLQLWAVVASDAKSDDPARLAALIAPRLEAWRRLAAARAAPDGARLLFDFGEARADEWMPDGVTFGHAPQRPGDLLLANSSDAPPVRIALDGAARRDPLFAGLKLAPGTRTDPGRTEKWIRAGRTIRTPTFTIEEGTLHVLVEGSGFAYAAVDSHRLNKGPLHGELVATWKPKKDGSPQWIRLNLKRYVGHRAHLEFTAPESGPMGVRRIVEVPQPPPIATRAPAPLVAALEGRKFASAADLASACQEAFDTAVEQFAAKPASDAGDTSADDPAEGDAGRAALADWIATHPKLFQVPDGEPATQLARLTGEFLAAQESLRGRLRHESRTAPAMLEGSGENELLLIRGSYKTPGERVPRRLLEALGGDAASTPARGSGRLELARQIVDPTNPLTARVLVNRVWHHLTGRGIVPSVDNFGVLGERPTHPELLDHLAARFVEQGWSLKQLIREIVQTQTYRMESRPRADNVARDPTNKLLHAMRMRRLQGEAIRDTLLTLSGRLDPKQFGPSVPVYLTEFMQGRGRPKGGPLDGGGRRSIYISVRRNFLSPMMLAFDTPIPLATMGRRNVSNVPAQALILMNDPLVVEQTAGWARRALEVDDVDAAGRIDLLYRQAFARLPGADEREAALDFLARQGTEYGLPPEKALADPRPWADLCHVLVNVKEFIFVR